MEFVTANLLMTTFNPLHAFIITLMVNARHLFYGISMLDRFKNVGLKKLYLIYGMCDETFSINCTVEPPADVDRGWFMFFVTDTQENVTGKVRLRLYKGNIINAGVWSPYSLYREDIATFDAGGKYRQSDATGFISIYGLPTRVQSKVNAESKKTQI